MTNTLKLLQAEVEENRLIDKGELIEYFKRRIKRI